MKSSPKVERIAMQNDHQRILMQIGHCLRQGCVICIQHAEQLSPRFTKWQTWGTPSCYNGDQQQIHREIDRCHAQHGDHHIRLDIEDYSVHSRFSFLVHHPDNPS